MKLKLVILLAAFAHIHGHAQTLFTYGNRSVSSAEFIRAFRKNGEPGKTSRQDVKDYLDLYTNFRLKVQDARDMKLDTIINKQEDLASFRAQIEEQFIYDTALSAQLVREAATRGQKELRLSHIFIPFRQEYVNDPYMEYPITADDSSKAARRINEAYDKLVKGEDFGAVALAYSLDPTVKDNKGDLGYISVFTLPYTLENIAYGLAKGAYSRPFASAKGLHILRNTGERPATGKLEIQQILLAPDPEGSAQEKQKLKKLADSLYTALRNGASFSELAVKFSYDRSSANNGGTVAPFSSGTYDAAFEDRVFGIKNEGDILAPFETSLGFHIVKKVKYYPVSIASYAGTPWDLAVQQDRRADLPRTVFAQSTPKRTGVKQKATDLAELKRFTDSALAGINLFTPALNTNSVLLEFPKHRTSMQEWLSFAAANKYSSQQQFNRIWERFVVDESLKYYRSNLENYDANFRDQMNDFIDGNLLFEAMERKVWKVAASDTALQRKVFNENRRKYTWGKSADAIVFTVTDSSGADALRREIIKEPGTWKGRMDRSEGRIMADSSRMEWSLISNTDSPGERAATSVVVNPTDGSASFVYVVKKYNGSAPKTFEQARGQVVNDCQKILEDKWLSGLRTKYPVSVDQAVLASVMDELAR